MNIDMWEQPLGIGLMNVFRSLFSVESNKLVDYDINIE